MISIVEMQTNQMIHSELELTQSAENLVKASHNHGFNFLIICDETFWPSSALIKTEEN